MATDVELWRRAVDGDPDSFGVVFERHARTVYNYLFRRTADWSLAEDLTSVVFLEAWRRRADVGFESEAALPWLLGVDHQRPPQQAPLPVALSRGASAAPAPSRCQNGRRW